MVSKKLDALFRFVSSLFYVFQAELTINHRNDRNRLISTV